MPRKRFVSPEFFTHGELYDAEQLTGLPLRLAYAGLWTACDRRGLFWWKPREMKLHIMPYDSVDFDAILWALESYGFVEAYVVDGKRFGRVPSFDRWQSFHKNEVPSDVPEPSNGWRETSKDRREPSPSVAVAVTTSTAVATTTSTKGGSGAPPPPKPRAEKKFPHFPDADREAAFATWTSKRGPINRRTLVEAIGDCWPAPDQTDRPGGAALLWALDAYLSIVVNGRSAPFANLKRATDLLIPLARLRDSHADPAQRNDAAYVMIHGYPQKIAA